MEIKYFKNGDTYGFGTQVPDNAEELTEKEYGAAKGKLNEALVASSQALEEKMANREAALVEIVKANADALTPEQLGAYDIGFVNNHTTDLKDGNGDGKWWLFGQGKIRHEGDDIMTRSEAFAKSIEIG